MSEERIYLRILKEQRKSEKKKDEEPKRKKKKKIRKYRCECCGEKELVKKVYSEHLCLSCGEVNYHPHRNKGDVIV